MPDPLRTAVAHVADLEIRGQATIGGNICAEVADAPRGDLQGAADRARRAGALHRRRRRAHARRSRTSSPRPHDRLVLDVSFDEPAAGGRTVPRPPAHARLHRSSPWRRRGRGRHRPPRRHRHRPARAAQAQSTRCRRHRDRCPTFSRDDALASAWYRNADAARCWCGGPSTSSETPHEVTVNGAAASVVSPAAHAAARTCCATSSTSRARRPAARTAAAAPAP